MEWSIPEPAGMATILWILDRIGQPLAWAKPAFRRDAPLAPSWAMEPLVATQVRSDLRGLAGLQMVTNTPSSRYWAWTLRSVVSIFCIMHWSIPEPAEMATIRWNDPLEGWSTFWLLAKPAGSGIMDLFESRTGVDVEAGRHNNG
jgi:hypothetical protein